MRLSSFILILFIGSSFLFLPSLRAVEEFDLFPFEDKIVIVNIQSTEVVITSNIDIKIILTVSRMDPKTESLVAIRSDVDLLEPITILIETRGNYKFQFKSFKIAKVEIVQSGIPEYSLIYLGAMFLIFVLDRLRNMISRSIIY